MRRGYTYGLSGQLKFYNRVIRSIFLLSEEERLVLLFVLDRTIGWKKAAARISMNDFQAGVFRRVNKLRTLVAPGTGLEPEQIMQAITNLVERGALQMESYNREVWYGIDEDWCHSVIRGSKFEPWRLVESDYVYDEQVQDDG